MNWEEIKKWMAENKNDEGLKKFLEETSAVSADKVKGFLETEDGKKLIQPTLDKNFNKGLETWKANNLETLVTEEVKKRNPEKSPVEIELESIKNELANEKKSKARHELKLKALEIAKDKIPNEMIDFLIGDDEESTTQNLTKVQSAIDAMVQKQKDDFVGEHTRNPHKNNNQQTGSFTSEQLAKMSPAEINANWDKISSKK